MLKREQLIGGHWYRGKGRYSIPRYVSQIYCGKVVYKRRKNLHHTWGQMEAFLRWAVLDLGTELPNP